MSRSKKAKITKRKRILIVDDDDSLVEVYKARLEIDGFEVIAKYDGESALRFLAEDVADLIILDCMLPKFGGLSILEYLKNRVEGFKTPVLMVSGLDRKEYKEKAAKLGAKGYLVKANVSISEMLDKVEAVIGHGSGA